MAGRHQGDSMNRSAHLLRFDSMSHDPIQHPHDPRITIDPNVMGGRPCIRGLRFPVSRLLGMLAAGQSEAEILKNHPDLEAADVRAAISYAAALADQRVVLLKSA